MPWTWHAPAKKAWNLPVLMLSARGMVEDRVRLTNIIDVYINHLRRKIEGDHEPRLIHAVRRLGYVIRDAHAAH